MAVHETKTNITVMIDDGMYYSLRSMEHPHTYIQCQEQDLVSKGCSIYIGELMKAGDTQLSQTTTLSKIEVPRNNN